MNLITYLRIRENVNRIPRVVYGLCNPKISQKAVIEDIIRDVLVFSNTGERLEMEDVDLMKRVRSFTRKLIDQHQPESQLEKILPASPDGISSCEQNTSTLLKPNT